MKLFLDFHTRFFALQLGNNPPVVQSVNFKRRDNDEVEVAFANSIQQIALPQGSTGQLGLKRAADYDGPFLAFAEEWAVAGTAQAPVYKFRLNLNTQAINGLFEESEDAIDHIDAMMEITWTTPDGVISTSTTLSAKIWNDVVAGDEGEPVEMPAFYASETSDLLASQSQAESGTDNTSWMSPLRTAQAIAALAATDWDSVTDKPTEFPPEPHTADFITDFADAVVAVSPPVDWSSLTGKPDEFPPEDHTHAAADITSGTLAIARIPTGTTGSTVALGNHTHSDYVSTSGGVAAIAVVATMPAAPSPTTLYIVTG